MKKLLLMLAALAMLAVCGGQARAATIGGPPYNGPAAHKTWTIFTDWTGKSATERLYSSVYDVRGWRKVAVSWKGRSFKNVSGIGAVLGGYSSIVGTFVIYGGPTATGPWSPVYVGTTKLSFTADGSVTFDNANNYIRVSWNRTRGAVSGYITVGEGR